MAIQLNDNVYNRTLRPDQPFFKKWSSAGLMLTYRCPSRCACCYVFSGPDVHGGATEMSVESALSHWRAVRNLAGDRGRVHITGGEPFSDYERLRQILQAACKQRLVGLEKIETNAYWCSEPGLVRRRLGELAELGLTKLQISTDIYHQQYIPIERVRLGIRIGREVLGADGVQVRWRDFLSEPVLVGGLSDSQRAEAFAAALSRRGERLLGRAAEELASLFPSRDYDSFADDNCVRSLLGARHVHVDGAANVFSGTCLGIILAKANGRMGLDAIWLGFDYRQHPIMSVLVDQGPWGLAELARHQGYLPRVGYAGKCHLCFDVRRFLYAEGRYHGWLGPGLCYGQRNCRANGVQSSR